MVSGKVVVDSFERYRSQEIIRQLEKTYGLEQVAPSWQTFKNKKHELEQNLESAGRQKLAQSIERASFGSPTMPEFFQRLASHQVRAEVGFTRNGKPKGITYQTTDGEKIAGNALGKAYSFPGLQKYLQVNYDPARDNHKLVEIVQGARQQYQELQPAREAATQNLEPQVTHPMVETVLEQPLPEQQTQSVWSQQYGIPSVQDLIRAIPEHPKELLPESADNANRQRELASAVYQQWALLARAVYRVESPQDVDQRIAFLMQSRQQTPKQITQVLAQSPTVQELVKRDRSYALSYSEFCQSQASVNRATWLLDLDQYQKAVEIEQKRQQQLAATHQTQALPSPTPVQVSESYLKEEIPDPRTQKRTAERLPQITDAQLVAAQRRVALYFRSAPTNPTDQQLASATERYQEKLATAGTANEQYRHLEQELNSASLVDKLRPGYREKKKEASKLAARFISAASEMERTQSQLNQLKQQRRTFEQWQASPQTQEMVGLRDYLNTKEAQTRLTEITAQQMRKAQEMEQKRGRGLSR